MTATVAWLSLAPVKGLRLVERDQLVLDRWGARGDRRFALIDGDGHLINAKRLPRLVQVVADVEAERLSLLFPDGAEVDADIATGDATTMHAYGETRPVRLVVGPWSEALSAWAGETIRLVESEEGDGVDRRREAGVTLLSTASLESLRDAADVAAVDRRRFRMTVGIDGVDAFEEERWIDEVVWIGSAAVRVHGNVGRCAVTTIDPETGLADLKTLHLLRHLREGVETTEALPFGVWAEVVEPGTIRVGDQVSPAG